MPADAIIRVTPSDTLPVQIQEGHQLGFYPANTATMRFMDCEGNDVILSVTAGTFYPIKVQMFYSTGNAVTSIAIAKGSNFGGSL